MIFACKTTYRVTPGQQGGLALVMVLWLIVLLSIVATGHVHNVHTETRLATRHIEVATARALTEAGIQHAILELLVDDQSKPWPLDGTMGQIRFSESNINIAIRDASGLIDLNAANPELLTALVATLDTDSTTQQEIVAAILDWRDADDLLHLNGAEDPDYLAAGHIWSARDGAFASVEELRYVMGMTQQYFDELAPFVTIYSRQAGINIEFAPPFLVAALTGQEIEPVAARQIDARRAGKSNNGSGTYHIYASTSATDGIGASAEAVIQLLSDDDRPYSILFWREPMRIHFSDDDVAGT